MCDKPKDPGRMVSVIPPEPTTKKRPYRTFWARSRGFTMIEILVVLAIIGILALISLPNFLDTIIRNDVVEALTLADIAKKPIADSWTLNQSFPSTNAGAGLPSPEKVVNNLISSLVVEGGAIHITFGNRANAAIKGKMLTLRPAVVKDAPIVPVAWVCGYAEGPAQMTVEGENKTNIPMRYLPQKCRPN
jgi:type IV pilus assembly protein PilA